MKYPTLAAAVFTLAACSTNSTNQVNTSSPADITAYTFGHEAGASIRNGLAEQRLSREIFLLGVQDALNDQPVRHQLNEEEISSAVEQHTEWVTMVIDEETRVAAAKNEDEGSRFRNDYANRRETQWLGEEILYTVLTSGNGEQHPGTSDTVEVHYEGRLPNGTVFDSSVERGAPVAVDLTQVIEGWKKVISQMKEGDKWEVVLPPSQAYGATGRAPAVGPNQTLIFKIELISII